jgi:hypothetical protein
MLELLQKKECQMYNRDVRLRQNYCAISSRKQTVALKISAWLVKKTAEYFTT